MLGRQLFFLTYSLHKSKKKSIFKLADLKLRYVSNFLWIKIEFFLLESLTKSEMKNSLCFNATQFHIMSWILYQKYFLILYPISAIYLLSEVSSFKILIFLLINSKAMNLHEIDRYVKVLYTLPLIKRKILIVGKWFHFQPIFLLSFSISTEIKLVLEYILSSTSIYSK